MASDAIPSLQSALLHSSSLVPLPLTAAALRSSLKVRTVLSLSAQHLAISQHLSYNRSRRHAESCCRYHSFKDEAFTC